MVVDVGAAVWVIAIDAPAVAVACSAEGPQEARRMITRRSQEAFFSIHRLYSRGKRAMDDEQELRNEKDQRGTVNARGRRKRGGRRYRIVSHTIAES